MKRGATLGADLGKASHVVLSIPPNDNGDPALNLHADDLLAAPDLQWLCYFSTVGVYGDFGGEWIDETAPTIAARARRGHARIDAERAWHALGTRRELPVAILRLGGIYGPGRNGMVRLLRGAVQRVAKPGHVSNRIHVYDIAQSIEAAFARRADGVFNIVDDEPASPSEQIAFAARLIGIEPVIECPLVFGRRKTPELPGLIGAGLHEIRTKDHV